MNCFDSQCSIWHEWPSHILISPRKCWMYLTVTSTIISRGDIREIAELWKEDRKHQLRICRNNEVIEATERVHSFYRSQNNQKTKGERLSTILKEDFWMKTIRWIFQYYTQSWIITLHNRMCKLKYLYGPCSYPSYILVMLIQYLREYFQYLNEYVYTIAPLNRCLWRCSVGWE